VSRWWPPQQAPASQQAATRLGLEGSAQFIAVLATTTWGTVAAPNYAAALATFTFVALAAVAVMTLAGRYVVPEHRDADFTALV